MDRAIYEVSVEGIRQIEFDEFHKQDLNESSAYLYDIKVSHREEAVEELRLLGLEGKISGYILEPAEHIRFEYLGNTAYGELAHFSSESKEPLKYIAVIIFKNILVFVYDDEEDILIDLIDSFPDLSEKESSVNVPSLLYVLIREILTDHAKLILSYREEIEDFAKVFVRDQTNVDTHEFLESKSILSDYSRALEKIHFSLSFPPVKSILDQESAYRIYFQELIKTTDVLKDSLREMGQRLDALHDHYHLMLQDKSNKRLNFLTIIQSIFVPITLLTGLYGMNFVFMPELEFKYGYFIVLGMILIIVSGFLRYFYKHGWFD